MDKMEVIILDSEVYKVFMDKLDQISSEVQTCRQMLEKNELSEDVNKMKKDWLETGEVVELLGISERTLLRLRRKKVIPFSRFGKKVIYPVQELKRYISETTQNKYKTDRV